MRRGRISILFGGLTAITSVAIIQILSIPVLDVPLTVTMYTFSFALPASAFFTISAQEHLKDDPRDTPAWYEVVAIITLLAGFAGLAGIFFHFGENPGAIFLVTGFMATATLIYISEHAEKLFLPLKKDEDEKKEPAEKQSTKKRKIQKNR